MKHTKLIAIPKGKEKVGHHTGCNKIFSMNKVQLFYDNPDEKNKLLDEINMPYKKPIPTYFFNCYEHNKAEVVDPKVVYGFNKELK